MKFLEFPTTHTNVCQHLFSFLTFSYLFFLGISDKLRDKTGVDYSGVHCSIVLFSIGEQVDVTDKLKVSDKIQRSPNPANNIIGLFARITTTVLVKK